MQVWFFMRALQHMHMVMDIMPATMAWCMKGKAYSKAVFTDYIASVE